MPISKLKAGSIATGTLDNARIPSLAASKIGSGTFADARIASSNVSQHATSFDDNKLVNDLSTLGLRVHTQENLSASNTNSQYVDVFQDATGYTDGADTTRSTDEYVNTITAAAQVKQTTSGLTYGGDMTSNGGLSSAFDGTKGGIWSSGARKDPSNGANISIDWGSGVSKFITRAVIWGATSYGIAGNTSSRYGKLQGSNDNGSWTDLYTISDVRTNSNMVSDPATTAAHDVDHNNGQTFGNTSAWRYHRWLFEGDNNGGTITELEFYTGGGVTQSATGNFTCPTITASSATTKMGAVITYQDQSGTNALNTDIVLQLSADNGSNFSTATLTALPDFSSGIKCAKVNDLAVTSGTQLKYKISFANQSSGSKEARIRGVSLNY